MTSREKRIELHLAGKQMMAKSDWKRAIALFREARCHGDNMLLLVDLAASEYMDGSLYTWKETLTEIESALARHREILSPHTLYNSALFLGKFLEEQGQFKTALASYASLVDGKEFDDRHKIMALSQLVRVLCFLGLNREAETHFVELSTKVRAFKLHDQKVEVLHALMLADCALIGVEAAVARFDRVKNETFVSSDLPLLIFDLLDQVFATANGDLDALSLGREVLALLPVELVEPTNGFETGLLNLFLSQPLRYREAFERAEEMSLTTQMRLAILVYQYGAEAVDRARAQKLISILLRSFDSFAAKALTKRFDLANESEAGDEILVSKSGLLIREETLNWSRKATALSLFGALADKSSLDMDEVVAQVWQADFNSSYADRLRVMVRRINVELQSVVMKPEVLVLNAGRLSIADGIRIRRV